MITQCVGVISVLSGGYSCEYMPISVVLVQHLNISFSSS